MLTIYNLAIGIYHKIILLASFFNPKAKQWINGRKQQKYEFDAAKNSTEKWVWFHFASLGEFEQGRPLLELYKSENKLIKIVITFFSPSGFENRKNYAGADSIYYLPIDSAFNAKKFIEHFKPIFAVFTKYEYWFHYFNELHKRSIPIYMVSSIFRLEQPFFKWYGNLHRRMLGMVDHFFVQDQNSKLLLNTVGIKNVSIAGDTRFDRVWQTTQEQDNNLPFKINSELQKIFIAGSTWKKDEELISELINKLPSNTYFIIVPHETEINNINRIKNLFGENSVLYSTFIKKNEKNELPKILIVDSIGILSKLYRIADLAYIGGGFDNGIHNILEAAAYGKPIIFGPNHSKFREANELKQLGGAFSISNKNDLLEISLNLIKNNSYRKQVSDISAEYVINNIGASRLIVKMLNKINVNASN